MIAATGFQCPLRRPDCTGREPSSGRARLPTDDQPLRERDGARHLLRGHHRPGRVRAQEVRHPGQLGGRPRRALQPAAHGRGARRSAPSATAHDRPRSDRRQPRRPAPRRRPPRRPSCGTRSRTWRARCRGTPDGVAARRGHRVARGATSTRPARTAWPSPSRRTTRATSTRRSTSGDGAGWTRTPPSTAAPLHEYRAVP